MANRQTSSTWAREPTISDAGSTPPARATPLQVSTKRKARIMGEWQPIKTAPRDGSWVLLWSDHNDGRCRVSVRQWRKGVGKGDPFAWYDHLATQSPTLSPTYWMWLPPSPKQ